MALSRQLYDLFFEGCTHYSMAKVNSAGKLSYFTEEGIPSLDLIEQHLNGEVVLGAYTLLPNNNVRWMAFDVDASDLDEAKSIARRICEYMGGMRFVVEFSGNKGYHIFIFFDKEISAKEARQIGESIREELGLPKTGDPHVEVYPKQDQRTEANPLGNLLRLPLGFHPVTRRKVFFVDIDNGWEGGPELPAEELLTWRTSPLEVEKIVLEKDPIDQIKEILRPHWTGGQRHAAALSLAGFLSSMGWTEEKSVQLVTELTIEMGGELSNLVECVTDTFEKVYNNQAVRGFEGLSEILSGKALQELTKLVSSEKFHATLQIVDRFRLGKGAQFQKVRWVASTVLTYYKENGSLVRDRNNLLYWNSAKTRETLIFGGNDWHRHLHTFFGLNPADAFGKQTMESIRLYAEAQAPQVSVHKRSHWDKYGEVCYINLGGPEVYSLNGDKPEVIYNGDNNIIFLNSEDGLKLPNLLSDDVIPIDPWEFLVNRIHFSQSETVQATPAQQKQLLKALIMSYFFGESMPTRPLLAIIAQMGAGKTTAARNILRFMEGLGEDVLGLVAEKPDALRSSIVEHRTIVLDNLEKTNPPWLTDVLNRCATGGHIEVRTLYKTNEVTKIVPNVNIMLTATAMPFSEETVFSRILPLELAFIANYIQEDKIQIELEGNIAGFWKAMLYCINECVREMKANRNVTLPVQMRLADFSAFCARIQNCSFMDSKELMGGLHSMVARQKQHLVSSSPFIQILDVWTKQRPDEVKEWMTMNQVFTSCKRIASSHRIEWRWTNAQGLSRHIHAMEKQLKDHFGMKTRNARQGGNEVTQYKFIRGTIEEDATETQYDEDEKLEEENHA